MSQGIAYARAGLLGNPSDGYHGQTISFCLTQFSARVALEPGQRLEIAVEPDVAFDSLGQFRQQIRERGYYGALRLVKAALKRFCDYCDGRHALPEKNFRLRLESDIPRQVGMAGSSAIITATLRSLSDWYGIEIPPHLLASLTLSVEHELGIPAGLQDRVIQAYQGLVHMDFDSQRMQSEQGLSYGVYERLPEENLSRIYVAYALSAGEPTEVVHNDLRNRYDSGDRVVREAMLRFAALADEGKTAILEADMDRLAALVDENFDLRASICELHSFHREMVSRARSVGCAAKYCGSGGAIVGVYPDETSFSQSVEALAAIEVRVIKPVFASSISG